MGSSWNSFDNALSRRIVRIDKAFCVNGINEFYEDRQNQYPERPNAGRDFPFGETGCIFDDFMQCRRDETWNDQSHPFLDPDSDDAAQAREHSERAALQCCRCEKENGTDNVQGDGGPNPAD